MKIAKINAYALKLPLTHTLAIAYSSDTEAEVVLTEIITDDGLKGYGEASPFMPVTGDTPATVLAALEALQPLFIGHDPLAYRAIIDDIDQALAYNTSAKAAIDIALHDLTAQYYKMPLMRLWGGPCRTRVETSLTVWMGTVEEAVERTRLLLDQGARIIKLKVGRDLALDIERVKAIRAAHGNGFVLRVDANQGYTAKQAVEFINQTEPYRLEMMEQPTPAGDVAGLKYVTRNSSVPIMADEAVHSPLDAIGLIREQACDLINIKVMKAGGLLRASEIATVAQSAGIGCMLGAMVETKIGMAAATHLAHSHPNILYADLDGHVDLADDPTIGGVETVDGCNVLADGPGLGVALDEGKMAPYLINSIQLNG